MTNLTKSTKLVAFEGPDCVGKSTQIPFVAKEIESRWDLQVEKFKIPWVDSASYTMISAMLKDGRAKTCPFTFQMAMIENRMHFQNEVLSKSKADIILVDRWNLSTVFYGEAQGVPSLVTESLLMRLGIQEPLCNVIFDGSPFERSEQDVLDQDRELQERIRSSYQKPRFESFLINANQDREKVTEDILDVLASFIL